MLAISITVGDGRQGIIVQYLDGSPARFLEGTSGASSLFWSPASDAVGFFAQGALRVAELASGTVRTLCAAPSSGGGTWSRGGVILFAPDNQRPLRRVAASEGACTLVTSRPNFESTTGLYLPQFLGDGRHFVVGGANVVWLGDLQLDTIIRLRDTGLYMPVVALPDWLFSVTAGSAGARGLFAQRVDASADRLVGTPRRILPAPTAPFGHTAVSSSATGSAR